MSRDKACSHLNVAQDALLLAMLELQALGEENNCLRLARAAALAAYQEIVTAELKAGQELDEEVQSAGSGGDYGTDPSSGLPPFS